MNPMIEELESLLFDLEAGMLDDVGMERIREILRSDEEARAFYVKHQVLNAAMKLDVEAGLDPTQSDGEFRPTTTRSVHLKKTASHVLRISYSAVAAAVLLICVLTGRLLYLEFSDENRPEEIAETNEQRANLKEATSSGVALLTRLVDIEWAPQQTPLEVGDALLPGRLGIRSGYAQLEFFCGATVIVEAPAELDLKSTTLARVYSGQLRAHVPPAARGFSLEVDDMKVVDLGTEFGLAVSRDGGAQLQVFDGEVELHPAADKDHKMLTAGEGVIRNEKGEFEITEITPQRFLDIAALETRADGQNSARYERWKAWSDEMRRDSRLIAYYTFDQQGSWNRKLFNSVEPNNDELDGAIVGARRVPGRWQKKAGLEFKRPGDRVRVQIPGEFGSLTFVCWVKIDSLDRWYNSLFLTDNYNQGEPHWQILDSGQLFFSVRHRPDEPIREPAAESPAHQKVLSPPFWKPQMSGRWLHLATTYDVDAGRTTHYLNGEVLHQEAIDKDLLVKTTRIGAASIGNWSIPTRPDAEFAIRNLNGSIDEFAIFSASLSADEIKDIYRQGREEG